MNRPNLEAKGFRGFLTISELAQGRTHKVPQEPGVYAVLRQGTDKPLFLPRNPGGNFKGNDPTVPVSLLEERWVHGTEVLYFGKADNLRRRIHQLCRFGKGEPVGHWGGRLLWQMEGSMEFLVGWLPTPNDDPFTVEGALIDEFHDRFGSFPLANIQRPRKGT